MSKKLKVSKSAYIVLRGYLSKQFSAEFSGHFSQKKIEILNKILASLKKDLSIKFYNHIPSRFFAKLVDIFGLPALSDHYVLRKNFIAKTVEQAIASGITQIVNIGSGYDALCLELAQENPHKSFFEIDITDSVLIKKQIADELECKNFFNAKFDLLSQDISQLKNIFSAYDSSKKTIFIIEGVLVYLGQENVAKIFEQINQFACKDSQLVFTNVEEIEAVKSGFSIIKTFLKNTNEEVKFTANKTDIEAMLNKHNFEITEYKNYFQLQEEIGKQNFEQSYSGKLIENLIATKIS